MQTYFTDYPIAELGDAPGVKAPIRKCHPVAYDGDKYCRVEVGGITTSFKCGYIYQKSGRCGEVPAISKAALESLPKAYPA